LTTECDGLRARIDALGKLVDEREERTKERFVFIEKNINIAMVSADKAINKSEMAVEKRFDSVNEFRASLADQSALMMPRAEYTVQHQTVVDRVNEVAARVSSLEDKGAGKREATTGIGSSITFALGIAGFGIWLTTVIVGAVLFLRH
jgi:hypothetical protein